MGTSSLSGLVRSGHITQSLRLVTDQVGRDPDAHVLLAELLYHAGDLDRAERLAVQLPAQFPSLTATALARLGLVRSSCRYDAGDHRVAMEANRQALLLAQAAKDPAVAALCAAQLLERAPTSAWNANVPLASEARKYTMRAGDPQLTARVHLVFGRLEGRVGHYETAIRHLSVARAVIESDPNLWISAALDLDMASVLGLKGHFTAAVELALKGAEAASASGWAKGQAMAGSNLAYFYTMLGKEAEAARWLNTIPAVFRSQPAYCIAITETLAQAALCKGNFEEAASLLEEPEIEHLPNLRWYGLSRHITRTQVMLGQGDWMRAKQYAEAGMSLASELDNEPAQRLLELCHAEACVGLDIDVEATGLFVDVPPNASLDFIAAACVVRGKALRNTGDCELGRQILHRGVRLMRNLGSAPAAARAELSVPRGAPTETPAPTLDAAVGLLELAGHPHILGPEAVALIKGAGCASALALVAAAPAGLRIVDAVGWTAADAADAAQEATDRIEHLPLGSRGDENWFLAIEPKRELEPYCTFATLRKLLAVALSLDAYRRDEKQRAALWPADALDSDPECVWASEQMIETLTTARRIAATPLSVLITGETGTGKEMVARAIHRASDRADRPFLPFNCAAVPRDLLESQLFGHRKGAFTGADAGFQGVIRSAAGGTLFLDEIGEIGPEMQPKLLRFLETHEIHPLGEPHPLKVDVRVIAATNASVEQMMADGRFRGDLFYRLNVMRLSLPPLRERREEIPPLVQHYVRKYGDEQRKGQLTLADDTLEYLLLFSWPGNVRQLANEVQRMVALAEPDSTLTPALLSPEIQASRRTIPVTPAAEPEVRVALDQPLPDAVDMLEQVMVRRALDRTHGRVEEASRLLGISRKGLFLKRRRWGLGVES
jgi:DNA-binding NtrC family response regulator